MGKEQLEKYKDVPVSDSTPEENWPRNGEIIFESATMRYRETLEPSLKSLNLTIKPR